MGYYDGKSFFSLDFSLHEQKEKNKNKSYGLTHKQIKERYNKRRRKYDISKARANVFFSFCLRITMKGQMRWV